MRKLFFFFALVVSLITVAVSCKKSQNLDELRNEELRLLKEYVETNKITVEPTSTGLYYLETEVGTGDSIHAGDRVKIFYTGMFIDSTIFDASGYFEPFEFIVGSSDVITGMSEGLTYMKQGGKATLIIPSNLAYGATNNYTLGIQRFATLIFDIEVYKHYKLTDTTTE